MYNSNNSNAFRYTLVTDNRRAEEHLKTDQVSYSFDGCRLWIKSRDVEESWITSPVKRETIRETVDGRKIAAYETKHSTYTLIEGGRPAKKRGFLRFFRGIAQAT